MAKKEIHKKDIGTIIEVTVKGGQNPIDISSATVKTFYFKKPSGKVLTKDAIFVTNGTDGKLKYVMVAGDLDEAGAWELQVYLELSTGTWRSSIAGFGVHKNI